MILVQLEEEGLLKRRIVATKPIQSFYALTEKGVSVAEELQQIKSLIDDKDKI